MKPLCIGMYGGGTVGGGVYELIQKNAATNHMKITKICVRSLDKPRDFEIDASITTFTTDPHEILNDDGIDCVVEVMGGTGLAKTVVETALQKGKTVVTANKALLAEHWGSLQAILKEHPESKLAWEAAVCGGIPIIQLLQTAYTEADTISSIMGICNGTTNFMLTQMFQQGAAYDAVLKEAQDLGFAEADPTADVEGHDVRAKILLLAQLAFGGTVPSTEAVPCLGISQISAQDFAYARLLHSTIKLIGTAQRLSNSKVSVYVTPMLVHESHALATVHGAGNAVTVDSQNLGACTYTGPGAGRYPTANSVVADLYRVVQSRGGVAADSGGGAPPVLDMDPNYTASFYIRVTKSSGGSGATAKVGTIGGLADKHGVGIASLIQKENDLCITTENCAVDAVQAFCSELGQQGFSEEPLFMPILGAP